MTCWKNISIVPTTRGRLYLSDKARAMGEIGDAAEEEVEGKDTEGSSTEDKGDREAAAPVINEAVMACI